MYEMKRNMGSEKIVIEAKEHKPKKEFIPGIIHQSEERDEFIEAWAPWIIDYLSEHEHIYIRKVNEHIEIGPANVEYIQ